jgi:hypothetical protein
MVRAHFNQGQVIRLVAEGQLIADPAPGTPPDTASTLPNGTLSHTVWIKSPSGDILYRTHCYVCPHGDLLGSGFLDPKAMYTATEILVVDRRHRDIDTCPSCGMWKPQAQQALLALQNYRRRCSTC